MIDIATDIQLSHQSFSTKERIQNINQTREFFYFNLRFEFLSSNKKLKDQNYHLGVTILLQINKYFTTRNSTINTVERNSF